MDLKNIKPQTANMPMRLFLYGPEKVGKSSFAMDAPNPIFFDPSGGTDNLTVARVPMPEKGFHWGTLAETVSWLIANDHDYKTLVIDEMGHIEGMLFQLICAESNVGTIEDVGGGYGKGYTRALDYWRKLFHALERLRRVKEMNVIFLAHSHVKAVRDPRGLSYDHFIPQLNEKAAGIFKQWCDAIFFCEYETFTTKDQKTNKDIGVATGARIVHTEHRPAFDAGNRYNLPAKFPLNWQEFITHKKAMAPKDVATILKELETISLSDTDNTTLKTYIKKAGKDTVRLAKCLDWARGKELTNEQ
jgi:hypothetical protein